MTDPTWFPAARTFIEAQEGIRLTAYQCPAGVWTIGAGLTRVNGAPVRPGQTINKVQADNSLNFELRQTAALFGRVVKVPLADHETVALASFTFALGGGALSSSTLLRKLNRGDRRGAADEFPRWDKMTDPKTKQLIQVKGLHDRRLREQAMFLGRPANMVMAIASSDDDWEAVA